MTAQPSRALAAAAAAQRAARAVAVDPCCEPRLAAHHVAAAWAALAREFCPEGQEPGDLADLPRWLPAGLQAAVGAKVVAALAATLPALLAEGARPVWEGDAFTLGRGEVEAHVHRLGALIQRAQAGEAPRPRWAVPVMVTLGAIAGVVVAVKALQPVVTVEPWRGTYYTHSDHTGETIVRHDRAVDFDWGPDPPMDEVPADNFSVRWDSCLHLDAPTRVIFQTISDDGSRLYVDGELVVRNRTKGRAQAQSGAAELAAGVHHVRVDYSELKGNAVVQLLASFDDTAPGPIERDLVSAPTGPVEADNPCE